MLTGISDFEGDGVALLYSMSSGCPTLVNLLNHLNYVGVPSNLVFADGKVPRGIDSLTAHRTGLKTPQLQSLLSQVFGHMLGRLVRLRLIERNGSDATHIPKDPGKFLINYDLAQRRLLDA